jgi:hypothetical protein
MTATSFLDLKQRLVRVSEAERQELSAFWFTAGRNGRLGKRRQPGV